LAKKTGAAVEKQNRTRLVNLASQLIAYGAFPYGFGPALVLLAKTWI
jgi:hypothetical protein